MVALRQRTAGLRRRSSAWRSVPGYLLRTFLVQIRANGIQSWHRDAVSGTRKSLLFGPVGG